MGTETSPRRVTGNRANSVAPPEILLDDIDLGSVEFWAGDDDFRDGAFATLRREAPIAFWSELQDGPPRSNGHWAVTRFDDISYVSRHPEIFSSSAGTILNDIPPEIADSMACFDSMIVMDDPRHQRLRSIVSRAFTPRVMTRIEASVRDRAHRLVSSMIANHPDGEAELVSELAGPLPLQIICDMMGIPEEDHQQVFHWTNVILGLSDPDPAAEFDELMQASTDMYAYACALAEDRRSAHRDDLTTALVEAEVDGNRLTSQEIAAFFILLVAAGNETTRHAISHGLLALSRHPEQRDKWWANFDGLAPTAVEEILRWGSPIIYMRRTLTQDFELSGVRMKAGDKLTMWYNSANRDESKFINPWAFDLLRSPNPHVAFGGGGAHFCLGANLARREIKVVFDELRREMPDIVATVEPQRLLSQFIRGIKSMPVAWTPPSGG
jgi:methyl-branched lipid omega-hydroxylase